MTQKRNRKRPLLTFQERLTKFAQDARARDGEAAAKIDRWLSSPDLPEPK